MSEYTVYKCDDCQKEIKHMEIKREKVFYTLVVIDKFSSENVLKKDVCRSCLGKQLQLKKN